MVAGVNLLLIWITAAGLAWRSHDAAVGDWKLIADNSSVATAAYVHQALGAADLVLKSMQDWVADEEIDTQAQFRAIMVERRFHDSLRARIVGLPQVASATIIDRNGDVLSSSYDYPVVPRNIAEVESFTASMAAGEPKLFIGALRRGRATQRWTFYLSRPVTASSGLKLGVVSIGLGNEFFSDFFQAVSLNGAMTISLFRTDGSLLATTAANPALLGERFEDAAPVRMAQQRRLGAAVVADIPRWSDPDDRRARIIAPKLVEGLPLLISTTVGREVYLADWWATTYWIVAIAVVLTGFTIVVAVGLHSFNARLEKANRVAAERSLLAALIDTPAALCAVLDRTGKMLYHNDRFASLVAPGDDPAGALSDPAL
jgi:PAS domain-containing protein